MAQSEPINPASAFRNGCFWMFDNFKWPSDIPKKPICELTVEQQNRIKNIYRFSAFTPGNYQQMTGLDFGFNT